MNGFFQEMAGMKRGEKERREVEEEEILTADICWDNPFLFFRGSVGVEVTAFVLMY